MADRDYIRLQQHYAGRYVATRDGAVVASAETYDALVDQLEKRHEDWETVLIEYVEPADRLHVY